MILVADVWGGTEAGIEFIGRLTVLRVVSCFKQLYRWHLHPT